MTAIHTELIDDPARLEEAFAVRRSVFIDEQSVTAAEEFDGLDAAALHVAAFAGTRMIGTGRLLEEDGRGRIGRMAVLRACRGRGVGRALLERLLEAAAARGLAEVYLHAQTQALPFYEASGFRATGPEFEEARIAHRTMTLGLSGSRTSTA